MTTSSENQPWTLSQQLGAAVRVWREAHVGVRQEDLVIAARTCGLNWSRSSVGEIEAGRRQFSADELVLLPEVLHLATAGAPQWDETVVSLLSTERMRREGATAAEQLRVGDVDVDDWFVAWWLGGPALTAALEVTPRVGGTAAQTLPALSQSAPGVAVAGDAERKAARKLGLTPAEVLVRSVSLWGHGLTAERDRRVAEVTGGDSRPSTLRAMRGHVTRGLIEELSEHPTPENVVWHDTEPRPLVTDMLGYLERTVAEATEAKRELDNARRASRPAKKEATRGQH